MTLEELVERMSSAEIGLWGALYAVEAEERKEREQRFDLREQVDQGIDRVRSQLRGNGRARRS